MIKIIRYLANEIISNKIEPFTSDSFFNSYGFMNLWRHLGGKAVYWVAENAGKKVAVMAGVEFGIKPISRFQAMPDGCYGRIFFTDDDKVNRPEIVKLIMKTLADAGYLKTFIYDYYRNFSEHNSFDSFECKTHLVDISSPDWQPPDRNIRLEVRRAVKEGIVVMPFNFNEHFNPFLKLMHDTEKRLARPPKYPADFFKALARLAEKDNRVQWLWCEHNGKAAASHIYFIESNSIFAWQIYFDKQFSFLKPNQYMLFATAKSMSQEGIKYLNLGSSSPTAASVISYKKKWGGEQYIYNCYYRKSFLGKLF